VDEVDAIDNHAVLFAIELLVELTEFVKFFLLVEVGDVELVLKYADKTVVLWQEGVPVSEITDS